MRLRPCSRASSAREWKSSSGQDATARSLPAKLQRQKRTVKRFSWRRWGRTHSHRISARRFRTDPLQHFSPVSLVAIAPLVLACHESLEVSNASELIELARKRPGEITYGTSAIGGAPHLAAELFQSIAGIEMRHVRYEYTERLYKDLEAGLISISFNNIMSMLPRCRGATLKALAVTSAGRSAVAPDVPTLIESGLPGYEVTNWVGVVAPQGTSSAVTGELAEGIARALKTAGLEQAFLSTGVSPCATTPAQFSDFMTAELRRWGPIVEQFRQKQEDRSHTDQQPGAEVR